MQGFWRGLYHGRFLTGSGSSFVARPKRYSPAYYYADDEVVVVASENLLSKRHSILIIARLKRSPGQLHCVINKNGEFGMYSIRARWENRAASNVSTSRAATIRKSIASASNSDVYCSPGIGSRLISTSRTLYSRTSWTRPKQFYGLMAELKITWSTSKEIFIDGKSTIDPLDEGIVIPSTGRKKLLSKTP